MAAATCCAYDLPNANDRAAGFFEKQWKSIRKWLARGDLPIYQELGAGNGKGYPEVVAAMTGKHQFDRAHQSRAAR